jgi:hypothetical protein
VPRPGDESGTAQNLEVVGDSRLLQAKGDGQGRHRVWPSMESQEDPQPGDMT